jgi:sulfate transport system permease protein
MRQAPRGIGQHALLFAVVAYLCLILLLPVVGLVTSSLAEGPSLLWAQLTTHDALASLWRSAVVVAMVVFINCTFGVMAALVLVRSRFVGRRLLDMLIDIPLTISPVMTGFAFLLLVGRQGWLAPVLQWLHWRVAFSFAGLVLATLFVTLPFATREVCHLLMELGTSEEDAAVTLGASPWQVFWRVTFPNIRHAVAFGITLTTARALGRIVWKPEYLSIPSRKLMPLSIHSRMARAPGALLTCKMPCRSMPGDSTSLS